MTKLFKKSLASVLSFALCLSAMVTASVAVAADGETTTAQPTLKYVVSPENPKEGDTVTVTLKAENFETVAGADIYATYSENITLDAAPTFGVKEGQDGVNVNTDYNSTNRTIKLVATGATTNEIVEPISTVVNTDAIFTYTFTAGEAGTEYKFDFTNDTKVRFCTSGEEVVNVTAEAKTVTVKAEEPTGPVLDETLKDSLLSQTIIVGNTFGFRYEIRLTDANYNKFDYDSMTLTLKKPEWDPVTYCFTGNDVETVLTEADALSSSFPAYGLYYFEYFNLQLSEMSLDVSCTVTLYKDGVATSYYTYEPTSLAETAIEFYNKYNGNDDVKTALGVDILNLGTAGQKFFAAKGTEGNDFAKFALPNEGIDQSKASAVPELSIVDGVRDSQVKASLILAGAPALRYEILENTFNNPGNVTITASYTSGNPEVGEVSKTLKGSELPDDDKAFGSYGLYYFNFDNATLYDLNKVITLTVTDGNKTLTHQYSVLSHISTLVNEETLAGDVFRCVAAFSVSAHAYWPTY